MKPINFGESNVIYAKDQPEYRQLPALKFENDEGTMVCCYKLSIKERIKLLFTGKLWMSMMTFNKPLMPIYPTVDRKEVYLKPNEK